MRATGQSSGLMRIEGGLRSRPDRSGGKPQQGAGVALTAGAHADIVA